mmetsp:Transcript_16797/g.15148  ORF Transcript_16797/g.15148 Transcript_16797/m.15148 type:complete len:167 (-) Transcript_16797:412-912(-)
MAKKDKKITLKAIKVNKFTKEKKFNPSNKINTINSNNNIGDGSNVKKINQFNDKLKQLEERMHGKKSTISKRKANQTIQLTPATFSLPQRIDNINTNTANISDNIGNNDDISSLDLLIYENKKSIIINNEKDKRSNNKFSALDENNEIIELAPATFQYTPIDDSEL